jgi:ribosomal protein L7/L12
MPSLSTIQEGQIRELMAAGNKIAAIKLYREITGTSLAEAKEAVEAMASGVITNFPAPAQAGEHDPFLENQIKQLLAERKKIEAVKVYREAYRCGLKEAKDTVDLIEAEMRREGYSSMSSTPAIGNDPFAEDSQRNRGCLILVLALVVVIIGGLALFFLVGNGF